MKTELLLLSIMALTLFSCNKNSDQKQDVFETGEIEVEKAEVIDENAYDAELAKKLGADEFGMKTYIMAFLKAGPNRSQDSAEAAALQRAHLDNINRMAKEGTLVLAGPFLDDTELRGIYLFDVATIEDAEELTKSDPMIEQGRLIFEFHPWYGAAVLPLVNDWYKKVTKTEI